MIQNWNTIEKIAKLVIAARAEKNFKVANVWERLMRKFADACGMVEEYVIDVRADELTPIVLGILAINYEAAARIACALFPLHKNVLARPCIIGE